MTRAMEISLMGILLPHLPILPILLPMMTGAVLLLLRNARHGARAAFSLLSLSIQLGVALALMAAADGRLAAWPETIGVYALGNWAAPYGIVLVVDRLAAMMVMLATVLGTAAFSYSLARWERAGVQFFPLLQFQLMGLNGAFLTGDLFNLFVFFEIMLAASYALTLYSPNTLRVNAGLHYIAVNLLGSLFFLVAAALVYGLTGTLNMAELPERVLQLAADDRRLFDLAAAMLGIIFLIKAAAWPLNFWLPAAYANAAPPAGAVFAILTKVGIYALLRMGTLLQENGIAPAPFDGDWLFYCGLTTVAIGTLGVLSSQKLGRLAAFFVIVSSGTLLTAFGFIGTLLTAPAMFYLTASVLGCGAFFMLVEIAERDRSQIDDLLAISLEAFGVKSSHEADASDEDAGVPIPAAAAFLGLSFVLCGLVLTGLPPMPGFIGKFAMLGASLNSLPPASNWHVGLFIAAMLLSGLAGIIALSRLGIRIFWDMERQTPRLRWLEAGPVAALLLLCIALTLRPEAAMSYFSAASHALYDVGAYIHAVTPDKAQ